MQQLLVFEVYMMIITESVQIIARHPPAHGTPDWDCWSTQKELLPTEACHQSATRGTRSGQRWTSGGQGQHSIAQGTA